MTDTPLDQYRKLMNELLISREAEGGGLHVELESSYVGRLDDLWWKLSESDQKDYEAELAGSTVPTGPESLNLFDCEVDEDGRTLPRRAA
jgi:hypothetical protein